ncbi:hypothetical protein [Pseudomonas phage Achelous]|uniref:Uncharacterized protein n=1 Tax=Pseudomonas phage Achelous TaxID=2163982 RepID=A0A2S1GMR3_9CAUD|nr:hypothetical protein HOT10_gp01 [Pseudomonas phage Achelous]AWD90678.1 hypothetical protein [Pseudomonas phage Achelous]
MRTYSVNPRYNDDDGFTIAGDFAFLGGILVTMFGLALLVGWAVA